MKESAQQPSIVGNLQPFERNDDEAISFEVTLDLIGQVVAVYTGRIAAEQRQPEPDQEAIATWTAHRTRAAADQQGLRAPDPAAVQKTRERYTALLRSLRGQTS